MKRDVLWAIWQMVVYGFLATLMIAAPASGRAAQSDERLEELFDRLRTTADPLEAQIIEVQIWRIWIDSGRDDMNAGRDKGFKKAIPLSGIALFGQNTSLP